jgi:hypothetical protein
MYEELGSVREPVDLSASEALSGADELLRRQGYRIIYRTGVMVVGKREDPSSLVRREQVHLAVFARPHPAGGLRITLQGDDREGVQERAGEWSRWADGLPKVVAWKERERPVRASGTPTADVRPKQAGAKVWPPANMRIGRQPTSTEQERGSDTPKPSAPQPGSEPPSGDSELKDKVPDETSRAWTSVGPWERKVRTAPGKLEKDPNESPERPPEPPGSSP